MILNLKHFLIFDYFGSNNQKTKKAKIFEIVSNYLKFSHIVEKGLTHLFLKFQ